MCPWILIYIPGPDSKFKERQKFKLSPHEFAVVSG